ncbi:hypothetical protein [Streptomyces sp. NPDC023327]|uniref:hypothetical protein n=1 Tax=Streptomyces sp. NPDC023327 TaxID=3157088 RepID=UPI0033C666EA
MSTRRPAVLRTAAASALLGGALLVPAAGAFADTPEPGPAAEVHHVALGNGTTAEVRGRGGAYTATVSVGDSQLATLSARHPTVTQSGVRYELYASNGHIGVTRLRGGDGAAAVPKGGVAAGAEGVRATGDPALLAAGGGMAAAGAAGLGYAMLRRGRTTA